MYCLGGTRFIDRSAGPRVPRGPGRLDHEPPSDAQLRERVRSRVGHWVSHPRAIEVDVQDGVVRVTGQVLASELDGLLSRLTGVPGVRKVHNALAALEDPSGFGELPRAGPRQTVAP
jgi:hypothetical protein